MPQLTCLTPLGEVTVSEEGGAIVALDWGRGRDQTSTPLLLNVVAQLQDYFDLGRSAFNFPLAPAGSGFQHRVWDTLRAIPLGETRSYADLARLLRSAPRAIGGANARNPIPILIPCHRVVAAGGALGGYSGGDGPGTKRWLLEHERRIRSSAPDLLAPLQGPTSAGIATP